MRKTITEKEKNEMIDFLKDKEKICGCKQPKPNYPEMVWCDECRKELKQ